VTLGGTAGATTVAVTNPSGDHVTYNLAVSGTTQAGTVVVTVASGGAHDTAGNANTASTSIDNTVTVVSSTRTWDGGGANNYMTTAANWSDDIAPVAGDILVFSGSTRLSPIENFPRGTVFDSIIFANGGFSVSVGDMRLTPAGGIAITNVAGQNQISSYVEPTSTGIVLVQAGSLEIAPAAQSLVLSGGGANIQSGSLILSYTSGSSPAATVLSLLTASYHDGAWDTGKFRSTTAVANGTTLGWNDDTGALKVTIMATLAGDVDLNGTVDFSDLNYVVGDYGMTGVVWAGGDINYDGIVDFSDLNYVVGNYGGSLPASISAAGSQSRGATMSSGVGAASGNGLLSTSQGKKSSVSTPPAKLPSSPYGGNNTLDGSAMNTARNAAHDAVFAGVAKAPGDLIGSNLGVDLVGARVRL
jgi:hypothetical protein